MSGHRDRRPLKALIFLMILVILAVGGYLIGHYIEQSDIHETNTIKD